ncbi:IQ and ubiquitin-like domain-containing protein [Cricetulus griseus]|uniref:IQ and ubiquitin-like domain-containing protein n=1 Tax=Cricetulus griseus TaxID=10029 RepID=G3HDM6_CRIGR|nr:IQ and ubiquitin-like domain-containing protein [Cricetulus griseus]
MSDAEEPVDPQTTTDSTADVDSTSVSEAAADVISIPRPSEEAEGSDVTRGRESETGEFITESEEMAEAPSERSISSAKSYDTKHRDEGGSTEKSSLTQEDEQKDATYQRPEDDLRFLTQIQEIKEIVQRTIKESSATVWRQEEAEQINQQLTQAERKAALFELLEKETQIIASIGRHRDFAQAERQELAIKRFLDKCSAPKIWRRPDGQDIEMDTQFTIRARELQSIYQCIMLKDLSQDERLDILLTLKHTVKEHECKLTQEILELIDREVDLMMRGVKTNNLEGLRKRITTLLFHYIKTPLFNPEVARHLKVPQDPLKFYDKIYFCHSCQLYLPSVEFSVSPTLRRMYRCRHCVNLENEIEKRESFLKYKCLLQRLYFSEADFADDSQIAYLMQLQDIKYLTENIWASQSVLSAWDDLNDLVMVRWDKSMEWSPWNCILLTKDEGAAHLKLESIEEGYERLFIHKIKHKHILAKNYFSQVPVLASILLADSELEDIRSKHCTDKPPKIIEARGSHT